jgi:uncharacterized protein (DUF2235 family)
MTGWGLRRNVKQLYKELCRIYDPGDKIFLFGFLGRYWRSDEAEYQNNDSHS